MSTPDNDLEFRHSSAKSLRSRIFEKLPLSLQVKFTSLRAGLGTAMPDTNVDHNVNSAADAWDSILHHPDFPKLTLDQQLSAFYWRGVVYLRRCEMTGQLEDLDDALDLWQKAIEMSSDRSSAHRTTLRAELGKGLLSRFMRTGDPDDLERGMQHLEQASEQTPRDSVPWKNLQAQLGGGLMLRYDRIGDPNDLERLIQVLEQSLSVTSRTSPARPLLLIDLGAALRRRYQRTGDPDDLERTIQLGRQALKSIVTNVPQLYKVLNHLALALLRRYERTGKPDDLEEAIQLYEYERRRQLSPAGAVDRSMILGNFGSSLVYRYALTGNPDDLDRAIQLRKQASELSAPSSPSQGQIGQTYDLLMRYDRTGGIDDLEQMIRSTEHTLAQVIKGSPIRSSLMDNLANAFRRRYERAGNPGDLGQAIQLYEQALELSLPDSPGRPGLLTNLGNGLAERYAHTKVLADLKRAIELSEQALELTTQNSPDRPSRQVNLGAVLGDRYERTGDLADLKRAIELSEQALELTPAGSPHRPGYLSGTANGLRDRYERFGDPADMIQAISLFDDACRSGMDLSPESALNAAFSWGNWAFDRKEWAEAVQAYVYGVEASERLFRVQLLRANKEAWLRKARGLHSRAAYALAKMEELHRAVEIEEQGHARLLAQVLERDRADLTRLEALAPVVYGQYVDAVNRLQFLEAQDVMRKATLSPAEQLTDAFHQAHKDMDAAVESIRQLPGYEEFLLKPPSFDRIQGAAVDTPLIYITVTPLGGLALIVSPIQGDQTGNSESEKSSTPLTTTAAVTRLWLDGLTEKALSESLVGPADDPTQGGYLGAYINWRKNPENKEASANWFNFLDKTTRWLWDVLMGQLVKFFTKSGVGWAILIPQGSLMLLPLHAAWTEDTSISTGRRYALDTVAFSYVSNALALARARSIATHVLSDTLLAIDEPYPVKAARLSYSALEVKAAASHFGTTCTILQKEKAGRQEFLSALSTGSPPPVWHLSCHGVVDFNEPLESHLLLANYENLTLRDLLVLRLTGVRLVILSACETGIPGLDLPDEVIGLPVGLAQAGAAGVVSSFWEVNERSTTILLVRFYDLWRDEKLAPIKALQQAQIWLRDTTNKEKAEYFRGFLPEFGASKAPATVEVTRSLHDALMRRPLGQRDFVDLYYWAAFGFTGV